MFLHTRFPAHLKETKVRFALLKDMNLRFCTQISYTLKGKETAFSEHKVRYTLEGNKSAFLDTEFPTHLKEKKVRFWTQNF